MRTYQAYRKAGLSKRAAISGQWYAFKLDAYYLPLTFRYWWFWRVSLPWLKWRNREEFKKVIDRMQAVHNATSKRSRDHEQS